jgi:hypothetical protein
MNDEPLGVIVGIPFGFWERFSPRTFRLGDPGPGFAEDLETLKPSFIECPHITWITVVEFFENVAHG